MSRRSDRGVALLEVLVALVILATAGMSALELLRAAGDTASRSGAADARIADQTRLLAALTLLSRNDLDIRLGHRLAGVYDIEVRRVSATLYSIAVKQRGDPETSALETVVYRQRPAGR